MHAKRFNHKAFQQAGAAGVGICLALASGGADLAEGDALKIGAGFEEGDERVYHTAEKSRAVGEIHRDEAAFEYGAKFVHVADGDGVNDGLLVGKEAVEPADRYACFAGDAARSDVIEGHCGEKVGRDAENALHGFLAAFLDGAAAGGFMVDGGKVIPAGSRTRLIPWHVVAIAIEREREFAFVIEYSILEVGKAAKNERPFATALRVNGHGMPRPYGKELDIISNH